MVSFLLSIVLVAVFGAGIFFIAKFLTGRRLKAMDEEKEAMRAQIKRFDSAIEEARGYVKNLTPRDEIIALTAKTELILKEIETSEKRIAELNEKLSRSKSSIAGEEQKLNVLKAGTGERAQMAEELKNASEQLKSELARLESELANSKTRMKDLAGEIELSEAQTLKMEEISASIEQAGQQLSQLGQAYEIAADRYVNLQAQYGELEKEYGKLIQKEIA